MNGEQNANKRRRRKKNVVYPNRNNVIRKSVSGMRKPRYTHTKDNEECVFRVSIFPKYHQR